MLRTVMGSCSSTGNGNGDGKPNVPQKKGDGNYEWSLVNINSPPSPIARNTLHLLHQYFVSLSVHRTDNFKNLEIIFPSTNAFHYDIPITIEIAYSVTQVAHILEDKTNLDSI